MEKRFLVPSKAILVERRRCRYAASAIENESPPELVRLTTSFRMLHSGLSSNLHLRLQNRREVAVVQRWDILQFDDPIAARARCG